MSRSAEAPDASSPCLKQVISLSFFRTGSQSLASALTILGYKNVHHSATNFDLDWWLGIFRATHDNIPSIPTYTGREWTREQWDEYLGHSEALTDLTPFALPLLRTYPEAKIILVHRDVDSWVKSYMETLYRPSAQGIVPWMSGTIFQPILGFRNSQMLWNFYMGIFSVSSLRQAGDIRILRTQYENHYDLIRRIVPADRLLDIELVDLDWKPLCDFLGKEIPDVPFPHENESEVYKKKFKMFHRFTIVGGLLKVSVISGAAWGVGAAAVWAFRFSRGRGLI